MLVLTRKTNQQIQIGENIVITILHVRGQSVRVGIEAPRQVRVVRSEIADLTTESAGSPQPSSMDEAETSDLPATKARRVKSPTKARANCVAGSSRAQTGSFSSPLADRVTAILQSPTSEASAPRSFPTEPLAGRQHGPHSYHFEAGRCSALTTHTDLSGAR